MPLDLVIMLTSAALIGLGCILLVTAYLVTIFRTKHTDDQVNKNDIQRTLPEKPIVVAELADDSESVLAGRGTTDLSNVLHSIRSATPVDACGEGRGGTESPATRGPGSYARRKG